MLLVFYGKGKGKSSAAYGTAIRALGHKWRVLIAVFLKDSRSGEIELLSSFRRLVKVYVLGTESFVTPGDLGNPVVSENMAKAYAFLKYILPRELRNFRPKLVIFDELGLAVHLGIVDERLTCRVLKVFTGKLDRHAVVTGRYVPSSIKGMADLISEVREVKHYFRRGFVNLEGLDY
ncbi:MAG: cob(I)yrinic acid a,c-diamide adenosyltransferase [Desulfurococcaceae archaeon]|nr:cob(I)yrinic acid a,c-diamide adenosyltransferase [Desulfurococcaceae archaeon]